MPEQRHTKVLIIGSGAAGYTAAIYAARANLQPVLVRGMQPGGQLTITTEVENYPGFAEVIQGPWLMDQMFEQAKNVGTEMIEDTIVSVDMSKRPFTAVGDGGNVYTGDTLIIATGASARWLGLESEKSVHGGGCVGMCDLRRVFLSQQGGRGNRRRQHGGRRSAVSDELSPARSIWCTVVTSCVRKKSCKTACSNTKRSR